jgi:hypothetical protein
VINNFPRTNIRRNKIRFLLLSALMLTGSLTMAQSQSSELRFTQFWIDFHPYFNLSEKLQYYGDLGYRSDIDTETWKRIYIRPSVRYKFSEILKFHAGVGLLYFDGQDNLNRFEITPWQAVQIKFPNWGMASVQHLIRVEERISINLQENITSTDIRFRYKIGTSIPICKNCDVSYWYVPIYAEFFVPLFDDIEEVFRNRTRWGIGLGYRRSDTFSVAVLFNRQRSRSGPENELKVTDSAFQLQVVKHWAIFKKGS